MSHKRFYGMLFPLLFVAIGVLLSASPALASPLVDCNVPGDHATIGDALADPACDVINVASAIYLENLEIDRDVTIAGAGAAATIIDGGGLGRVILITDTATVTITDVTITNGLIITGAEPWGGGIYNYDGDLLIMDSAIVSNTAYNCGGLLNDGGAVTLYAVDIVSNTSQYVCGGIGNDGSMYLEEGSVIGNFAPGNGGGVQNSGDMDIVGVMIMGNHTARGGGVLNLNGTLRITDSLIAGNAVTGGTAGGLYNLAQDGSASMRIENSRVIGNQALASAGGGGIANAAGFGFTATLTLREILISQNLATPTQTAAGAGGGILNGALLTATGGTAYVDMKGVVLTGNTAANGAGIASANIDNPFTILRFDIADSAIVSNSTLALTAPLAGNGGGILNFNSTMRVVNSTVSGNTANGTPPTAADASGLGGGIANAGSLRVSTVTLINTTVANNQANVAGGGIATLLAHANAAGTGVALVNTIVANNTALLLNGNCTSQPSFAPNAFASLGNNVEDLDTCNLTLTSDKKSTDPLLLPLAGNGGDTWTHALPWGSPAIDAGSNAVCQAQVGPGDQRGWPRIVGAACDAGAYEASARVWAPLIQKQ